MLRESPHTLQAQSEPEPVSRAQKKSDRDAAAEYFTLVYQELKKIAHSILRGETAPAIDTTALVHEAFFKVLNAQGFADKEKNMRIGLIARAMRQVLVDLARNRKASKRDAPLVPMDREPADSRMSPERALAIDAAIEKMTALNPRYAQVMEMKCFGDFSVDEIAAELNVSPSTVARHWRALRAFLAAEIGAEK